MLSSTQSAPDYHLEDSAVRFFTEYHFSLSLGRCEQKSCMVDFLRFRFFLQDCVLSNFLYSEINVNVHFRSGLPTVSRGHVHSCGVSRSVSCPDRLSHFAISVAVLFTTSLRIGCCCCTRQLLFSVTSGAGLGVESFEQHSISFLRNHSMNEISWHKMKGDDRK